ncbi:MAG: FtsX-like permease family protein [Spirochaetes bacterium]|jgi:putative ABC transport system permease protein|nr:FtsX-like permease family protein [Spirochaetota bacterium]
MKQNEIIMVAKMSFRNLGRHHVKTIITSLAIAISVALYIFLDAWILGMNIDSRRNIVVYEMGAAKIQTQAYFNKKDELPMYESFTDWRKVSDVLEQNGYISAPRFVFSGTMYSRTGSAPLVFNAVNPNKERKLLRYPDYIDAGSFIRPGERGIVIGFNAAEKLRVGIPQRPDTKEFETELLTAATNDEERQFIHSLYVPYNNTSKKKKAFATEETDSSQENRLVLRDDVTSDMIQRFWNLLSATGRMNVRISTTIDIKALPERIKTDKFNREIVPLFRKKDLELLNLVYEKDPLIDEYILTNAEDKTKQKVLSRLLEADYNGAVKHVNQLIDAVIVGVINSPNPKTNANIAYLPIDTLQTETGLMLNNHITELLIRSASANDSDLPGKSESAQAILSVLQNSSVSKRFNEKNNDTPTLQVYYWEEYAKDFLAVAAGDNISTKVMIFFLFLLSFLGIANTMLMAILQRTKEIGMLRALGMTEAQLMLNYILEAALIGLIGSSVGIIIGCLINIPMVNIGVDYSAVTDALDGDIGYRIASRFKSVWNISTIVASFFIATFLSGCMAILPTLRALRMPVTETLRFE